MKKVISILCSITMLITTINIAIPTFASTGNSIDTVVEELSELYQDEAENGKELEDSAECRIIVKSNRKPDIYGDAQFVKGTDKIYIYQYSDITSANAALKHYNSLSYVQWAEADGIMEDQSFSYGNDMMGSDEAKDYIKNNSISTNEVNVAVIDGGINFKKKDFIDSGRVIDSGVNLSTSGTEGTAQADLSNQHGSNITSILLDNTTDNVNIIGYKAMNSKGKGTDSAVAMCIMTAVDDNMDIINLSLGGKGYSELIVEAVNYAITNDVVVIASAGNYCDDTADYYPASIEDVITVGSVDYNGNRTFFSNYGEEVDFVAPGYNVEVYGGKSISSGEPDYVSGTSFSAPFVASAAAMALTLDKDLSINQVESKLMESCVSQSEMNYKNKYYRAIEISNEYLAGFVQLGNPEAEELFYGHGMPQMQYIAGLNSECNSVDFSISSGVYNDEFELTLSTNDDSEIYYTTNEKYPSKSNATLYTNPIKIDSTTCIRAIAYSDTKIKSSPSAMEYKIEYLADENDFEIDERGYITKYNGKGKNGNYIEIKVPDTINGKIVRGVATEAFLDTADEEEIETSGKYDLHLKGISLPDTVEEIEDEAFFNLFSLKYFTAKGLKAVGDSALEAPLVYLDAPNIETIGSSGLVTNLSDINLPKLTYADDGAFRDNIYLSNVNLPSLTEGGNTLFYDCRRLTNAYLNEVKLLGDFSFEKCYWLKNISLHNLEDISYFGNNLFSGMFYNCINLIDVDLPKLNISNSKIKHCFGDCYNLESVNAPELELITDEMFSYCDDLKEVNIPKAETIGESAFFYTSSLNDLSIPNVKSISKEAFGNSAISYIDAPELHTIGSYIFSGKSFDTYIINNICKREITIIAPKLKEVSDYAFAYTKMIHSLDLPSLERIATNTFYKSSVNYVSVPNLKQTDSLPITDNSVIVTSNALTQCTVAEPNPTLYIQGEKGSYAEKYANEHNLEFIDLDATGRSIRVTNPGLRFGYSVYDTQDKNIDEYGFIYHYNYDNEPFTSAELTVDNVGKDNIRLKKAVNIEDSIENHSVFNLVFTNIPNTNHETNISVRAYICIDGIYFYSNTLNGSYKEVANLVLADDEIGQATKDKVQNLLAGEVWQ